MGEHRSLWGMTTQPSASSFSCTPTAYVEVAVINKQPAVRDWSLAAPRMTLSTSRSVVTSLLCQKIPGYVPGFSVFASQRGQKNGRLQAKKKVFFPFTQGLILAHYNNIMKIFIGACIMP